MYLLTPDQVAQQLSIDIKKVSRLPITRVRIGARIIRYRQEDVDLYIQERLEAPGAQSAAAVRKKQKKSHEVKEAHMGLITREALNKIREAADLIPADIEHSSPEEKRQITRLKSIVDRIAKKKQA